jgi:hypothetical protein
MINLPNIDGTIWDKEYRVMDIIGEILTTGECFIRLDGEGPCAETLGLYDILDYICEKFEVDKKAITIQTRNQLETHQHYNIKIDAPLLQRQGQDFYQKNQQHFQTKHWDSIKTFGLFIGRGNFLRLWLASETARLYRDKTLLTYHYNRDDDFSRAHCGIEGLVNRGFDFDIINQTVDFLAGCPRTMPREQVSYPILTPSNLNICRYYNLFFCEIVCETYFNGNTFYPTEKIWRPLMMKTPFIVQGPLYYLDNLKKIGFKTFDRWWNEGYQHDPYDYQPDAILEIMKRLSTMSTAELASLHEDMTTVLQHNHDRFMELRDEHFVNIFCRR